MNVFKQLSYFADALGKYHSSLFFSDTVFPDAILSPNTMWIDIPEKDKYLITEYKWKTPVDVLSTATLYHETVHFLQDLATGFGCIYCFATRDFLHHLSGLTQKLGVNAIKLPLSKWVMTEKDQDIRARLAYRLNAANSNVMFIESIMGGTEYMIDPNFAYYTSLSGFQSGLNKNQYRRLSTIELIEGMAFLVTKKNVEINLQEQGLADREDFHQVVDFRLYGDLYASAINAFETGLFSVINPNQLTRAFVDNLFLLIADYALLIPPPQQEIIDQIISGNISNSVFNPLSRFTAICGTLDKQLLLKHAADTNFDWLYDWFDMINERKHWISTQKTVEHWIKYLQYLGQKTPSDITINFQINAMKMRSREPSFILRLCSLKGIYSVFSEIGAPMLYRTASGVQWRYFPKDDDFAEEMESAIRLKDHLLDISAQRSISMVVADHMINGTEMTCPIYGWVCNCDGRSALEAKNYFITGKVCPARRYVEGFQGIPCETLFSRYV